jgi:hypothetical protein
VPRFLRRNLVVRGLAYDDVGGDPAGIYCPGPPSENLIVPQVIAWPFSTDDAGVSFPSGIVGVRSVSPGRATEKAWATPGDPLENLDEWIAVPDTLPVGYTARPSRDVSRGPVGVSTTKGSAYLKISTNGAGQQSTASGNYTANGAGSGQVMDGAWLVNGLAVGTLTGFCPSYRPSGGGGIVPLGLVPINVGKQVLHCIVYEAGGGPTLPGLDAGLAALPSLMGGMAMWTQPNYGMRRVTWRHTLIATPANWAVGGNTVKVQFIIGHNAAWDRAGYGDTNDYASTVFTKSDFSTDGVDIGFGLQRYTLTHTSTAGVSSTAARTWIVGFSCKASSAWAGDYSGNSYPNHTKRVWLSPRLDVPPWFSVYGAGLGAPGGV